jgi:RecA-family ATPase
MNAHLQPPGGVPDWAWESIANAEGTRWTIPERDATGEVIGTAYRHADGSKSFKIGGKRGLIMARPLSPHAGLSFDRPIYIVEGASDVGALLGLALDVIGVPMAGHCGDMLAVLLAGLYVVIVADADAAGRRGAAKLAAELLPVCASVRVIEPPENAKDARDAVIACANADTFRDLAKSAPKIEAAASDGDPIIVNLADVEPAEVPWLWKDRIPRARLTLLVGRPGEAKSFATTDFAARVSTGRAWPDGALCEVGSVLFIAGEDDPADTIRPRLDAHGADVPRVHLLQAVQRMRACGGLSHAAFTLEDLAPLQTALARLPDTALVIIDPIGSFIGGRVDAHRDNEVRGVLSPLAALARQTGAAILLVAHQRKGAASHADDLVLGSRAFTGIARSVLHLMRDPSDDARRLLLPGKANLSRPAPGLAFTIDGEPARIQWEPGEVPMTADSVLAAASGSGEGSASALDEAVDWLRDVLAAGPMAAKEVRATARTDGIASRTLDRAKTTLGIVATREGYSSGGRWVWALPHSAPSVALVRHSQSVALNGDLGALSTQPDTEERP